MNEWIGVCTAQLGSNGLGSKEPVSAASCMVAACCEYF